MIRIGRILAVASFVCFAALGVAAGSSTLCGALATTDTSTVKTVDNQSIAENIGVYSSDGVHYAGSVVVGALTASSGWSNGGQCKATSVIYPDAKTAVIAFSGQTPTAVAIKGTATVKLLDAVKHTGTLSLNFAIGSNTYIVDSQACNANVVPK